MHKNLGVTDRRIRVGAAVLLAVAALVVGVTSLGGIVLLVLAAVMAVTATVGFCPLYAPFRINTDHRSAEAAEP